MPPATIPVVFVTSFLVGFSGAVVPGPLLVYNIRESVRLGAVAGPLVVVGHALVELAVVVGLAVGVARFLEEGLAGFVIGVLGGLFLLWMGWGMVRHPGRHAMPNAGRGVEGDAGNGGAARVVAGGALVSVSNPFWSLWWATVGLGYVVWAADIGAGGLASFYTGHILSDLVWYGAVVIAVASGRRVLSPGVYRAVMFACGCFLLALSVFFVESGVGSLRDFLAS